MRRGYGAAQCRLNSVHGSDTRVATVLVLHIDKLVSCAGRVEQCLFHHLGSTQHLGRQTIEVWIWLVPNKLQAVAASQLIHNFLYDL